MARVIAFTKMTGAGNDFVIIDNRNRRLPRMFKDWVPRLCDRKRGIGADGVCLIEASRKADFRMRIINSDGGEAEMCGNGLRCAAFWAYKQKIVLSKMRVETMAGVIPVRRRPHDRMELEMVPPTGTVLHKMVSIKGKKHTVHHINTGVPHTVVFVKSFKGLDVHGLGRALRYHKAFMPAGTNVNFVVIKKRNPACLAVRTYERGVEEETLACGTGATASALIGTLVSGLKSPIEVCTHGGDTLDVRFSRLDNVSEAFEKVFLEGPNQIIYEGCINV